MPAIAPVPPPEELELTRHKIALALSDIDELQSDLARRYDQEHDVDDLDATMLAHVALFAAGLLDDAARIVEVATDIQRRAVVLADELQRGPALEEHWRRVAEWHTSEAAAREGDLS